jgi:hypothetical protein
MGKWQVRLKDVGIFIEIYKQLRGEMYVCN